MERAFMENATLVDSMKREALPFLIASSSLKQLPFRLRSTVIEKGVVLIFDA